MWHYHFGVNWAALSYASWLLFWLSMGVAALYIGVMYALEAAAMLKHGSVSMELLGATVPNVKLLRVKKMVNDWTPLLAMFIVGYVLGSASVFSPVREFHNVEVLSKNADRVYTVKFQEYAQPMPIRLCAEGDDLPLAAGMVIETFQYIQQKECLLINQDTFDDWLRDVHRNVIDKRGRVLFAKEQ